MDHGEENFAQVGSLLFLIEFGEIRKVGSDVLDISELFFRFGFLGWGSVGLLEVHEAFGGQVSASSGGGHHGGVHGHHEGEHGGLLAGDGPHHHLHLLHHAHGVEGGQHLLSHAVKLLILGLGHM